MRFSTEWIADAENLSAEERSTLCELGVFVGGSANGANGVGYGERNVSTFYDIEDEQGYATICLPAVHLAKGIASSWWRIFGARDIEHSVLPWRTGFALPDLRFAFDGQCLAVRCDQSEMDNPPVSFLHHASESLNRSDAEQALATFVGNVVHRLAADDVAPTEVALAWQRVCESRTDDEEAAFCEAAGALGADPYAISDGDADFIEDAARHFEGEALVEFLAGVRLAANSSAARVAIVDWLSGCRPGSRTLLPDLASLASQLSPRQDGAERGPPWARGVRIAKASRAALGIPPGTSTSIKAVAEVLGGVRLARTAGPSGIYALVARNEDGVHIHLRHRGSATWARDAEKFAFARALGDAISFPDTPRAPINNLHQAERQAVGRAFAAEFTAPVEVVMDMWRDGKDIDDIAGHFGVNSQVVHHQIDNAARNLAVAA